MQARAYLDVPTRGAAPETMSAVLHMPGLVPTVNAATAAAANPATKAPMEKTSAARALRLQKVRREAIPASALLDRAYREPYGLTKLEATPEKRSHSLFGDLVGAPAAPAEESANAKPSPPPSRENCKGGDEPRGAPGGEDRKSVV